MAERRLPPWRCSSCVASLRSNPKPMRIRFSYEAIYRNIDGAGDFKLHRGDMVEVE